MAAKQSVFDGVLFSTGCDLAPAPVTRSRVSGGKVVKTERLSKPFFARDLLTAPQGTLALYSEQDSVGRNKVFCVVASTGEIRATPMCCPFSLSFTGQFALAFYQPDEGHATRLVEVRTGRVLWQGLGVACAAWSASGEYLIFARFLDNGRYWPMRSGTLPFRFDKETQGYRHAHTRFFALKIRSSHLREEACSSQDAKRLVGPWYGPFVDAALQDDDLALPIGGNVVQAPRGQGVWLLSAEPGDYLPTSNFRGVIVTFIDASGKKHGYKNLPPLEPIQWSRDGRLMYARRADRGVRDQEVTARGLYCLDTQNGVLHRLKLAPLLDTPLLLVR